MYLGLAEFWGVQNFRILIYFLPLCFKGVGGGEGGVNIVWGMEIFFDNF